MDNKLNKEIEDINGNQQVSREFKGLALRLNNLLTQLGAIKYRMDFWEAVLDNKEMKTNSVSLIDNKKRMGIFEVKNKKYIALRTAFRIYRMVFLDDSNEPEQNKEKLIASIRSLDPEFLRKIIALISIPEDPLPIKNLRVAYIKNPALVGQYIKTHYDELINATVRLKDRERAETLYKVIITISNAEEDEILKCEEDVRTWPYRSDRVSYGINLFIERVHLFLLGGRSKYDGKSFLGFRMHFKDADFARQMLKSPEIRRLVTYLQEIAFFRMLAISIKKSVESEGNWEGFYSFYNNLDKGQNYIRQVREKFGNEEFAALLEAFKEKHHEAPVDWDNELIHLMQKLNNPTYADRIVIDSAAKALIEIFNSKKLEISKNKVEAMNHLRNSLSKDPTSRKMQRAYLKIIARRKNQLVKELEKERANFKMISLDAVISYDMLVAKMENLSNFFSGKMEEEEEKRVIRAGLEWRKFITPQISFVDAAQLNIPKYRAQIIPRITQAIMGTKIAAGLAERELHIKKNLETKPEESIPLLHEIIRFIVEIKPQFEKCSRYIEKLSIGFIENLESSSNISNKLSDTINNRRRVQ